MTSPELTRKEARRLRDLKNKERKREVQRRWYLNNKEKTRKTIRAWQDKNRQKLRGYELKRRYNITEEQYQQIIKIQNGCCAICKNPRKLIIDHNHITGKVRGLLCYQCNFALGLLQEDFNVFTNAIEY